MPKLEHKILGFHGGINNNSGAKGSALSSLNNVASTDIQPGYGLHYFSTDYDSSSNNNPEDYLAIYNKTDNKVKFYYRDKNIVDGGSVYWNRSIIEPDITPIVEAL